MKSPIAALFAAALMTASVAAQPQPDIEARMIAHLLSLRPLPRPAAVTGPPKDFIFGRDALQPQAPLPADASPAAMAAADARLESLAPLFKWPAPVVPAALQATPQDECAFELGSTALRYRADPDAHRDRFFALLAIDDYPARAAKQLDMKGREDLGKALDDAFARRPGLKVEVPQELALFCELRRKDVWFVHTTEGPKSLARAVRLKMVQLLLAGTDEVEDVPGMVRMIDAFTDLRHTVPQAAVPPPSSPEQDAAAVTRLEALIPYFDAPLPASLQPAAGEHCAVALVATAHMYRTDPDANRERLQSLLEIDDYAERAAGIREPAWAEDIAPVLTAAFSRLPTLRDQRLRLTVAYCELARSRPWVFTVTGERIALARLVRGAMLNHLLNLDTDQSWALVGPVDERLSQAFEQRRRQVPSGN